MTSIAFRVAHADDASRDRVRRAGGEPGAPGVFILNGHGRAFAARGVGGFSIKWMASGRARYELERRPKSVSPQAAVLVDHEQPYAMEFEGRSDGESFCLFYAPQLVAEAWSSVEAGFAPAEAAGLRAFPNVSFAPSPRLARLLGDLRADGPDAEAEVMQTRALLVLGEAVATAHRHRGLAQRTPAARPAVRAHLVGLVEGVRERLEAAGGVGCSLDNLAREAGLSKFHLLRLFKAVHGHTPMAHAERLRMGAAERRLRSGVASIGEVAADLGYESPSAFAKAFRRWTGAAPSLWRN